MTSSSLYVNTLIFGLHWCIPGFLLCLIIQPSIFPQFQKDLNSINGMLRHSLATLEGEQKFIDFYRALLSREGSPLSLPTDSRNHELLIKPAIQKGKTYLRRTKISRTVFIKW